MAQSSSSPACSRDQSKIPTARKSPVRRPKVPASSESQQCEDAHNEENEEMRGKCRQCFARLTEEFVLEEHPQSSKYIARYLSMERPKITPGPTITVEEDSMTDIYGATPGRSIRQSTTPVDRQRSHSTAHPTLSTSSASGKARMSRPIVGAPTVKLEPNEGGNGKERSYLSRCAPPLIDERNTPKIEPQKKSSATAPMRLPDNPILPPFNSNQTSESSSASKGSASARILPPKSTSKRGSNTPIGVNSDHASTALLTWRPNPQKQSKDAASNTASNGKVPRPEPPPILPPPKARTPATKTSMLTAVPTNSVPSTVSPPRHQSPIGEDNASKSECCKIVYSHCTPKSMWDMYELGHQVVRPHMRKLKDISVAPSSVSSFGPNDDIPPSEKMQQEARNSVIESTNVIDSKRLSRVSPSVKRSHFSLQMGLSGHVGGKKEKDIHKDYDLDNPTNKTRFKASGNIGKQMPNESENIVAEQPMPWDGIEKELTWSRGRLLRSNSIARGVCAYKLREMARADVEVYARQENESESEAASDFSDRDDEDSNFDSDSEHDSKAAAMEPSQKNASCAVSRAPPKDPFHAPARVSSQVAPPAQSSHQGVKRTRGVSNNWEPTPIDDADVAMPSDDDNIMEIDEEDFKNDESNRPKRRKRLYEESEREPVVALPAPKNDEVTESESACKTLGKRETAQVTGAAEVAGNSNESELQQPLHCEYILHSYWEHGQASDGRQARDGFVSYAAFRKYFQDHVQPTEGQYLRYKRDLKHHLLCDRHAILRPDLHRAAWNLEHNVGINFKSCSKDGETRRREDEAIGNAPSSSAAGPASTDVDQEVFEDLIKRSETQDKTITELEATSKKLKAENKKLVSDLKRLRRNAPRRR